MVEMKATEEAAVAVQECAVGAHEVDHRESVARPVDTSVES
jgi:hypothetical protein